MWSLRRQAVTRHQTYGYSVELAIFTASRIVAATSARFLPLRPTRASPARPVGWSFPPTRLPDPAFSPTLILAFALAFLLALAFTLPTRVWALARVRRWSSGRLGRAVVIRMVWRVSGGIFARLFGLAFPGLGGDACGCCDCGRLSSLACVPFRIGYMVPRSSPSARLRCRRRRRGFFLKMNPLDFVGGWPPSPVSQAPPRRILLRRADISNVGL